MRAVPAMDEISEIPNSVIVRRLTKTYGAMKALNGVSFRIAKGEVVGFLGPNGAGKSTTMRILAGLMPATSGSAHICGVSVANHPDLARRHIGYMPENNPLPEDLRVVEYLRFRAKIKDIPASEVKARVDEVMETCQLHRKAAKKIIGNLSKGFRQRVGIADAILAKPEVIIMDEPTIGLDPHQILAIRELVRSLRGKMSVIISSHILPEIEQMCDRVMIINQGSIVASGSYAALRKEFIAWDKYDVSLKLAPEEFEKIVSGINKEAIVKKVLRDKGGYYNYVLRAPSGANLGPVLIGELSKDTAYGLREVSCEKPGLEDIFMAATKRSWEQIRETEGGAQHSDSDREVVE